MERNKNSLIKASTLVVKVKMLVSIKITAFNTIECEIDFQNV